jgi:hypothetical protein
VVPEAGASNRCLTPGLDAMSQGPAAGGEKAVFSAFMKSLCISYGGNQNYELDIPALLSQTPHLLK